MPRLNNVRPQQQRNVEVLEAIAEGQEQRTVLEDTRDIYISKCRVMTRILNELNGVDSTGNDVRALALELDADGNAIEHIGAARGIYRLHLPMRPDTARRLFAAISVDTSLPKKRRRIDDDAEAVPQRALEDLEDGEGAGLEEQAVVVLDNRENGAVDNNDPGRNLQTVCAQTYQNYKSALKWWHLHHDPISKGKFGYDWPATVDDQINQQIKAYKRDVGMKKRRGVMSAQGVPGFITLQREFRMLRDHYDDTRRENQERYEALSSNVNERIDALPDKVVSRILDNIRIEGAQPVSINSIRSMMTDMMSSDDGPMGVWTRGMTAIVNRLDNMDSRQVRTAINEEPVHHQQVMATGRVHIWPGDDMMHRVPHGFRWPNGKNTMIMWNFWFFGEACRGIVPYKFITPNEELCTRQCKTDRSRTVKVIYTLIDIAVNAGKINNQRCVDVNNSTDIFDYAFGELMRRIYPDNPDKRGTDLTVTAVYERMRKIDRQ